MDFNLLNNNKPKINMACYYPYCPSLQEEFVRLFAHERNVQVVAEPIGEFLILFIF